MSDEASVGELVKPFSCIEKTCMILIPEGIYASEMIDNLEINGWNCDNYVIIPYTILFCNELNVQQNIREIFKNSDNHFIVCGSDWRSVLFRDLMRESKRHFDFSVAELGDQSIEDLSYVLSIKEIYVVVFDGLKKNKLLEAGVPEEKIMQFG